MTTIRPYLRLVATKRGDGDKEEIPVEFKGFIGRLRAAVAEVALSYPDPVRCQGPIADKCKVNRGSFSVWIKKGEGWEGITMQTVARLAKGLGVNLSWLLLDIGERSSGELAPARYQGGQNKKTARNQA